MVKYAAACEFSFGRNAAAPVIDVSPLKVTARRRAGCSRAAAGPVWFTRA
jgi:hypothetical protein